MPRTMPSVGFIETQRATDSPSCWATSAMTSIFSPVVFPSSWIVDGVVDRGELPFRELDVEHRPDDRDDFSDVLLCHAVSPDSKVEGRESRVESSEGPQPLTLDP